MIQTRRADELPDWSLVWERDHMWIFRIDPDCAPMIGYLARVDHPSIPAWPVHPYRLISLILPDPPVVLRVPADEIEAITNLAAAGFTVELIT